MNVDSKMDYSSKTVTELRIRLVIRYWKKRNWLIWLTQELT